MAISRADSGISGMKSLDCVGWALGPSTCLPICSFSLPGEQRVCGNHEKGLERCSGPAWPGRICSCCVEGKWECEAWGSPGHGWRGTLGGLSELGCFLGCGFVFWYFLNRIWKSQQSSSFPCSGLMTTAECVLYGPGLYGHLSLLSFFVSISVFTSINGCPVSLSRSFLIPAF